MTLALKRHIDQQNRIKSLEINQINPCIYSKLVFDEGAKNIQWGKDSLFIKWYWENWISTYKNNKTGSLLYSTYKY